MTKSGQKAKKRRQKLILKGLCTLCGKQPPRENLLTCFDCASKRKQTQRKSSQKRIIDGKCLYCNNPPTIGMKTCPDCRLQHNQDELSLKNEVYAAYGGYTCACCGETEPAFLSIDHIENNGCLERKQKLYGGGGSFYRYLRKNNYPAGYQVLCMNCQWGKRKCGACPHQLIDRPVQKSSLRSESSQ